MPTKHAPISMTAVVLLAFKPAWLALSLANVGPQSGQSGCRRIAIACFCVSAGDSGEGEQSFREERERHSGPKAKDLGA